MRTSRTATRLKLLLLLTVLSATSGACGDPQDEGGSATEAPPASSRSEVALLADVDWGPLNPARGEKGPKAGTLWGDRTGPGSSGFLVEFLDGFESPPHIHNVSYRGVVIEGLVHNDDPGAAKSWMPAGSFWTQPKGAVHITAAKGSRNLAYIEIDQGPYLVLPTEEAFESEEVPINVASSNLVWIDPPGQSPVDSGAKVAFLWGDVQEGALRGALLKLPPGFSGTLRTEATTLRAVVIQGDPLYRLPTDSSASSLEPGSSFSSEGASAHQIACGPEEWCLVYLRTDGDLEVIDAQR